MNYEELKSLALESGFTHTAPLDTATIELKQDVRDMCAQGCQQYARRWSCPPGCGTLDQLRGSIYCYKEGILVQTVTKLEDEFYNLTGTKMVKYFRPPEGEFSRASLLNVKSLGFKTIFWSIAYKDWDTKNQNGVDYCVKTIMDNLHNGAIILMHSVSSSNQEALPTVIEKITQEGYTFKTVNEL